MAVERRNPLPIGRYWVDILDTPRAKTSRIFFFDAWLAQHRNEVKVIKKEEKGTTLWSLDYTGIRDNWYLFDVVKPVEWPRDKGFGFPSIVQSPTAPNAPPVTSSADTVQRPPVATATDMFADLFADAKTVALVLGALYLMSRK
jgi:hypothetical protein